jgi:hypothetical protein
MRSRSSFVVVAFLAMAWAPLRAAEPAPIAPDKFESLHQLIKPQAGESRWREIPWLTSVWEARTKAAAEGKPIYIIYGGGAAPIGGC